MKFTNFLKLSSQTLFVGLSLLSSNTYAASAANIQVNHCSECGQVLIGAARVDFKGIVWTGRDAVSGLNLNTVAQAFGFTGDSIYLSDTPPVGKNPWTFNSPRRVSISNPSFGDNINHYFAPFEASETAASHEYVILSPTDSKTVAVKGVGVTDDVTSPAITLNVVTNQGSTQVPCGEANICQVPVTLKGAARFTITPTVDDGKFSGLALAHPGLQEVKYVLVKLRVTEKDTQCSRGYLSFKDSGVGSNSFKEGDYYHYLEGGGPSHTPDACTRNYSFLVSANKSFQFQTTNNRDTGQNGYAEYAFYVNGHYDSNNPDLSKWPGSWKVVQLGNHFPPVTGEPDKSVPVVANLRATPLSGPAPLTVTLDTSGFSGTASLAITDSDGKHISTLQPSETQFTFSKEGTYTITLTTTDAKGGTASDTETVVVNASTSTNKGNPDNSITPVPVSFSAIQRTDDSFTVDLDLIEPIPSLTVAEDDILWWGIPRKMLGKGKVAVTFNQAGMYDLSLVVTGKPENTIKGVGVQVVTLGESTKQLHHTVGLDSVYYYEARVKLPKDHKPGLWYLEARGDIGTQFNAGAIPPAWLNFQIADNQPKPVSLEVPTGNSNLIVTLSSDGKEYAKYDPPSQLTNLPAGDYLPAGNYVMNIQNNAGSNEVFSMSLTYDKPINYLNFGGWIDSGRVPKVGFLVNSPQRVDFNLQFGESFQGGAEKPEFALCRFDLSKQTWIQVLPVSDKNEDCQ